MKNKYIGFVLLILCIPAYASDFSMIVGAGKSSFAWCGNAGCWHEPPLPYSDDRRPVSYLIGLRLNPLQSVAFDVLYHHFDPVRVSGTYVYDEDYNPQTHTVNPHARTWANNGQASMVTRTDGMSLSLVPHTTVSGVDLYGRIGLFFYKQTTDFTYPPNQISSLREAGHHATGLWGVGIGHSFKTVSLALETFAFKEVKYRESPVGGGGDCGRRFGLVSYILTARFKL